MVLAMADIGFAMGKFRVRDDSRRGSVKGVYTFGSEGGSFFDSLIWVARSLCVHGRGIHSPSGRVKQCTKNEFLFSRHEHKSCLHK